MSRAREFPDRPRILVLKIDHIGDFVLALRPLAELRKTWPNASITLVCGPWNENFARRCKIFDRVVAYSVFPEHSNDSREPSPCQLADFARLELGTFDLAIDLRHDQDTRPLLDLVETRFRAAFAARGLNKPIDLVLPNMEVFGRHTPLHSETRLMVLIATITAVFKQAEPHPIRGLLSDVPIDPGLGERPYIVVAPGAGKGVCKWPLKNYLALTMALIERTEAGIVLAGNERDVEDANAISATLPPDRCRDLTGSVPLEDLPGLLSNAALFIGNDSGPTHLAALLGVPTICVFSGANHPSVWQPIGPNVTVIRMPVSCSPCHLFRPEQCRFGLKCLTMITSDQVLDAAVRQMELSRLGKNEPTTIGNSIKWGQASSSDVTGTIRRAQAFSHFPRSHDD